MGWRWFFGEGGDEGGGVGLVAGLVGLQAGGEGLVEAVEAEYLGIEGFEEAVLLGDDGFEVDDAAFKVVHGRLSLRGGGARSAAATMGAAGREGGCVVCGRGHCLRFSS